MLRLFSRFGALLLLTALPWIFACQGPTESDEREFPSERYLMADPGSVTLEVGQTFRVRAILKEVTGLPMSRQPDLTWVSSDPDVVRVSDRGLLLALAEGAVTITADCGQYCAHVFVTVLAAPEDGTNRNS
jgi:hypothetical protein